MPLFECSVCHVVENTALCNFWWEVQHEKKPALCSQCDPAIKEWHGKFDRTLYADYVKNFGIGSVDFPLEEQCKTPAKTTI